MSLNEWGGLLIVFGAFLYVFLVGSARLDHIERQASMDRHPARGDTWVHVRPNVYDWAARGDFE